jgi:hypothetical protein
MNQKKTYLAAALQAEAQHQLSHPPGTALSVVFKGL